MKKFHSYISGIFLAISGLGFLITLKNIGMSEAKYYGIENDEWRTSFGEFISGILFLSLLLQLFISFYFFIICILV